MRGLWRPMATYGLASIAVTSLLPLLGSAQLGPAQATLLALAFVPMPLFLTLRGVLPGTRFLTGMRDGGLRYEVLSDDVGWFGDRQVRIRTAEGEWFLVSRNGREVALHVRGPHLPRRAEFRGDWRRAGRLAATVRDTPWKRAGLSG